MLTEGEDQKWVKGCSLAFSIIFGVGSLSFSFLFKDVMVSFMNILIYIGMAKYYFELEEDTSNTKHLVMIGRYENEAFLKKIYENM